MKFEETFVRISAHSLSSSELGHSGESLHSAFFECAHVHELMNGNTMLSKASTTGRKTQLGSLMAYEL